MLGFSDTIQLKRVSLPQCPLQGGDINPFSPLALTGKTCYIHTAGVSSSAILMYDGNALFHALVFISIAIVYPGYIYS